MRSELRTSRRAYNLRGQNAAGGRGVHISGLASDSQHVYSIHILHRHTYGCINVYITLAEYWQVVISYQDCFPFMCAI